MVGRGRARAVVIVLLPPGATTGVVALDPDEAHHVRVRRAAEGERVGIRNGAGLVGSGVLERSGAGYSVRVTESRLAPAPRPLALAVGAGDKERFAWLAEKAAELDVTELVPLETAHTAGVASRVRAAHVPKLARRALEATKQSGAAWAPRVHLPVGLADFLASDRPGERWLADAGGAAPLGRPTGALTVLVGPEAGLRDDERAAVVAAEWLPVRLGAHVLRFETAALAAAVVAGYLNGGEG
jgi:16S rRNA (uracil1498-N3)-methyltransferase